MKRRGYMKKSVIVLSVLYFITISFAQAPDTLWTRTFGGVEFDDGYYVQQTADGGFVLAGYTNSIAPDIAYVVKTDSQGDTMWTKTYRTTVVQVGTDARSIQQTSDNGYIITGGTMLNNGDILLIKTDSLGDTLWTKMFGGFNSTEWGGKGLQTTDNGYIIVGEGESSIWLIKTDSVGDTLWIKTFGGEGFAQGHALQVTGNGGYIIAGATSPTINDYADVYIVRTDSFGDTLWTKTYGGSDDADWATSIVNTFDGGYAVMANSQSYGGAWFLMLNDTGDTVRTKIYPAFTGLSLQQTSDSGFILSGRSPPSNGNLQLYKIDFFGDTLWTRSYGGSQTEQANSIDNTNDGGFIVAGYTESFGSGNRDIWFLKIAPDTFGIVERKPAHINDHRWRTTIFNGPLILPAGKNCKVFDITGRVMMPDKIKPGIYFVEIDGAIPHKVIKIK